MKQLQYRERSLDNLKWEIYGEYRTESKSLKQAAKDLQANEFRFIETRVVDTKTNPELAIK